MTCIKHSQTNLNSHSKHHKNKLPSKQYFRTSPLLHLSVIDAFVLRYVDFIVTSRDDVTSARRRAAASDVSRLPKALRKRSVLYCSTAARCRHCCRRR